MYILGELVFFCRTVRKVIYSHVTHKHTCVILFYCRKKLRSKSCKLEAMLKQRGVSRVNGLYQESMAICSTPIPVSNSTSTSNAGSLMQSPPCGDGFYTYNTPTTQHNQSVVCNKNSFNKTGPYTNADASAEVCDLFQDDNEEDLEMARVLEQSYFSQSSKTRSRVPLEALSSRGNTTNESTNRLAPKRISPVGPSPSKNVQLPNDGDDGM